MGFFFTGEISKQDQRKLVQGFSIDYLHQMQCHACPLNNQRGLQHPHMPAYGTKKPLIYILGEAPGQTEDKQGKPFVGKAGDVLRFRLPLECLELMRWNNVVRTRPPDNRDPTYTEIECCRPGIVADIEETQPPFIFGFGNVPLNWALDPASESRGINKWRGRRAPVKIGSHVCWYYAFEHPSSIARSRKFKRDGKQFVPWRQDQYGSDSEFAFAMDLKRAFAEIQAGLPDPIVHTKEMVFANTMCLDGSRNDHADKIIDHLHQCWDEPVVGLDYETSGLKPYNGELLLTTALSNSRQTLVWANEHPEAKWSRKELQRVYDEYTKFLHEAPCRKIAFGLPFEMLWSAYHFGPDCLHGSNWGDAQGQAYILDERQGALSLDFLSLQYFGINLKSFSNVNRKKLATTPLDIVMRYNGPDARYGELLWYQQEARLQAEGMIDTYNHQQRRVPACVLSEMKGVPVSQAMVHEFADKYQALKDQAEHALKVLPSWKKFAATNPHEYQPASAKDVKAIFKMFGIHLVKTEEVDLNEIAIGNDEAAAIARHTITWRQNNKVLSTYILTCLANGSERSNVHADGLLHPTIALHKTRTWRTSCLRNDSLLETSTGPIRADHIKIGMLVWTHRKRWRPVIRLIKKPVEQMYIVHFSNGAVLICTEAHQLLTSEGFWVTLRYVCTKQKLGRPETAEEYYQPLSTILSYDYTNCERPTYPPSLRYSDLTARYTKRRTDQTESFEIFGFQDRQQKPDDGEDWQQTPTLQRGLPRWQWLPDQNCKWQTLLCASDRCSQDAWDSCVETTGAIGHTPYRQESIEQRGRQYSDHNTSWSPGNSQTLPTKQAGLVITRVVDGGCHQVYDFEIDEDHSYEAAGGFSHNSEFPNIQNWPKRVERTKHIRRIVTPIKSDERVVTLDYSGIQARNVAMESKDRNLVQAFWDRYDIHSDWRHHIAERCPYWTKGLSLQQIEKPNGKEEKVIAGGLRHLAKNKFVFPSFFGAQAKSVADPTYLNIDENDAKWLQDKLWSMFPEIHDWQKRLIASYYKLGYVTGKSGFRRHAPIAQTELINAPIQADEVIIVLTAMAELSELGEPQYQPIMEIHDSLEFIWPEDRIDEYAETVITHMVCTPYEWAHIVPIEVEMSVGKNWCDLEEVGAFESRGDGTWKQVKK